MGGLYFLYHTAADELQSNCLLPNNMCRYSLQAFAVRDGPVHTARSRPIHNPHVEPLDLPPVHPTPAQRIVLAQLHPPSALRLRTITLHTPLVVQGVLLGRRRLHPRALARQHPSCSTTPTLTQIMPRACLPIGGKHSVSPNPTSCSTSSGRTVPGNPG